MAPKNSATKQDDERKSRPSEPPINGGKCPTLYHRWDIKFAGTIIESLQCNNQLYPLKDCPICPEMFESEPTSSENQTFHLTVKQTRVSTFQIGVGNRSDVPVWLDSVLVFDADGKLVKILVKKPVLLGAALEKGISKDIVTVEEMVLTVGRTYRVILKGKSGDDNSQEHCKLIIEQYRLTEDESKVNSKRYLLWYDTSTYSKCSLCRTEFNLTKLRPFIISPLVSAMYTNHSKIDDSSMQKDLLELIETSKQEFSPSNYGQQIDLLNQIELHHLLQEFGKYTLQKPVIQATESPLHYNISIEQFAVRPSLLSEDVRVQFVKEEKSKNVFGYISKITAEMIVILVEKRVDIDDVTRVVFHVDRSTFQLEQTAVVLMKEPLVEQICFPTAVTGGPVEAIDSVLGSSADGKRKIRNRLEPRRVHRTLRPVVGAPQRRKNRKNLTKQAREALLLPNYRTLLTAWRPVVVVGAPQRRKNRKNLTKPAREALLLPNYRTLLTAWRPVVVVGAPQRRKNRKNLTKPAREALLLPNYRTLLTAWRPVVVVGAPQRRKNRKNLTKPAREALLLPNYRTLLTAWRPVVVVGAPQRRKNRKNLTKPAREALLLPNYRTLLTAWRPVVVVGAPPREEKKIAKI
ncbi:hypothetical protein RP20_CCG023434 [Aedes albopictus]|nr:hypothetical protein RP20_CCG023434 [Aedes albopictus]